MSISFLEHNKTKYQLVIRRTSYNLCIFRSSPVAKNHIFDKERSYRPESFSDYTVGQGYGVYAKSIHHRAYCKSKALLRVSRGNFPLEGAAFVICAPIFGELQPTSLLIINSTMFHRPGLKMVRLSGRCIHQEPTLLELIVRCQERPCPHVVPLPATECAWGHGRVLPKDLCVMSITQL